jgi:hypothetical protein
MAARTTYLRIVNVGLRLTFPEYEALKTLCDSLDVSVSDYIRMKLRSSGTFLVMPKEPNKGQGAEV